MNQYLIVLPFKHISTNQMYMICRRRLVLTEKGRDFKARVIESCKAQYTHPIIECDIKVDITLIRRDRRRFDIDNIKALLDSLNGLVWKDDSQIINLHITKKKDNYDEIIIHIQTYDLQ